MKQNNREVGSVSMYYYHFTDKATNPLSEYS